MRVLPVTSQSSSNAIFKGEIKYINGYNNQNLILGDLPSKEGLYNRDYLWDIKRISPKFATVHSMLENYHSGRTGKVYIAEPGENVDPKIRREVDYIVYDDEPKYPDVDREVSRGYFHTDNTRYEENYEEISKYQERRRISAGKAEEKYREKLIRNIDPQDSKEKMDYFAWIQRDAKQKQIQAMECLEIYNKAKYLKGVKEEQGRELYGLSGVESSYRRDIHYAKERIKDNKQDMERRYGVIESIINRLKIYRDLSKLQNNSQDEIYRHFSGDEYQYENLKSTVFRKEKDFVEKQQSKLFDLIKKYRELNASSFKTIKESTEEIANLSELLANLSKKIAEKKALHNDTKAKLIPLFEELKNCYIKHGLIR